MPEHNPDVLILGGGAIGLACAHYLLQAGRSVHVIERDRVGAATSHGNCGTITPSHAPPLAAPGMVAIAMKWTLTPDAPLYVPPRIDPSLWRWLLGYARRCNRHDWWATARPKSALLEASRGLLAQLVREEGLDCHFAETGLTYAYRSEAGLAKGLAELPLLRELGIECREWSARELAEDEPALLPGMAGGIHFPRDAHLRPDRYSAELARRVREQGGVIEENCSVRSLSLDGDRIAAVETSLGKRQGAQVLLAAGPWTAVMAESLRLRLPIQPGKGYSITYDRPALAPRRPLVLKERSVCVTAWDDGFRLGSTMEFSGFDTKLNRTRLDALERGAREYLREPVGPVKREEWFGWRPMSLDDLPLIGRAPGWRNAWLAAGHGMMGMSMSAATGRLLADLVCGREPLLEPVPYDPARFS